MTEKNEDLENEIKIERTFSKLIRKIIKNPQKMCHGCLQDYVWQTPNGLMLCDLCNEEYCNELKTKME